MTSSEEEIKNLSTRIKSLKDEIAIANTKLLESEAKIAELNIQITNYNESVESKLKAKDREILIWKCVGGVSVGLVVVTAVTVVVINAVKK